MTKLLRYLFFALVVRVLVLFVLGLNVRHGQRLPKDGPAILVANHNSHLDTLVLMTLLPQRLLPRVRPVAAADYFMASPMGAWFSLNIIGIVPVKRGGASKNHDSLAGLSQALARGEILIVFPEGSRGEPEKMQRFKSGIAHLAERHPEVPVTPVFLHGLGKALPKGEALLVPFFCDVFVGEVVAWGGERKEFLRVLDRTMGELAAEGRFPEWE